MRIPLLLDVALLATLVQATPYQRRYYNTSVATSVTKLPPFPPGYGCSGCVIQANVPETVSFSAKSSSLWTSVVQVVTNLTKEVSYYTGQPETLETVVTTVEFITQDATFTDAEKNPITYSTPVFTVTPTPGVTLQLPIGTYLFYNTFYGGLNGLDNQPDAITSPPPGFAPAAGPTAPPQPAPVVPNFPTQPTCLALLAPLDDAVPSRTQDWRIFYHSVSADMPAPANGSIPSTLLNYLNKDPQLRSSFDGTDLNSCTVATTSTHAGGIVSATWTILPTAHPESSMAYPSNPAVSSNAQEISATRSLPQGSRTRTERSLTYVSTTYQGTTTQIQVRGCLRCDTTRKPETRIQPSDGAQGAGKQNAQRPGEGGRGQAIYTGSQTLSIRPVSPYDKGQGVVVGTVTLQPGATTTINNIPVAVPKEGGGKIVVIGTNSYQVLPTGAPVISVGDAIISANSLGQYILGTQTLLPGGPAITVNGYTMSLGQDGTNVVINGVTQTLVNSPFVTGAPILTLNNRLITATVIDGTTEFVLGQDQTLLPGQTITVSGTTYYMPADASGTIVVINGVTSTLGLGPLTAAPAITIAGTTYAATVRDGTTEYVLGPGTTLRPGDVVTIDGTTYSLDALNTALVVNGQTSTMPKVPASNSATPTSSVAFASASDGAKFVETSAPTSSKGGAASGRRVGMDVWVENVVIGLASWIVVWL